MDDKHMKKCSTSLTVIKMWIKITMRDHLTVLEWLPSKYKKEKPTGNNNNWQEYGQMGTLVHYSQECKMEMLQKIIWVPQKIKIELPYNPGILLPSIYPKWIESRSLVSWRDFCILVFIATVFTIVKMWTQTKCPLVNEWKS